MTAVGAQRIDQGHVEAPPQAAAVAKKETVSESATKSSAGVEKKPVVDPVAVVDPVQVIKLEWTLQLEDERIDLALTRWARAAGYGYRWDAERYFPIAAPTSFAGDFEDAVRQLLSSPGILKSTYPLEACIYANRPPLLRITRMGNQSEECR